MGGERDLEQKWDRAISTCIQYSAIGLAVGGAISIILMKRSPSPVFFSVGVALGKAHSEAEYDFSHSFNPRNYQVVSQKSPSDVNMDQS